MKALFCLLSVTTIALGGCQPNFQMGQPSSTSAPPVESPANSTNPNPLSACASLDGLMRKELTNQWLPNRIARFEDGSQILALHCHDAMENDFTHQVNFAEGSMLSYVYLKNDWSIMRLPFFIPEYEAARKLWLPAKEGSWATAHSGYFLSYAKSGKRNIVFFNSEKPTEPTRQMTTLPATENVFSDEIRPFGNGFAYETYGSEASGNLHYFDMASMVDTTVGSNTARYLLDDRIGISDIYHIENPSGLRNYRDPGYNSHPDPRTVNVSLYRFSANTKKSVKLATVNTKTAPWWGEGGATEGIDTPFSLIPENDIGVQHYGVWTESRNAVLFGTKVIPGRSYDEANER